jgi:hypothetical protein
MRDWSCDEVMRWTNFFCTVWFVVNCKISAWLVGGDIF